MSANDGGPAFPSSNDIVIGDVGTSGHSGMSLRDYFAAKAMVGHLANPSTTNHPSFTRDGLAAECYQMADAMLAACEGK